MNDVTRRPSGPYLIESSPAYGKRRACLLLQRLALLPVTVVCAAVPGIAKSFATCATPRRIGVADMRVIWALIAAVVCTWLVVLHQAAQYL